MSDLNVIKQQLADHIKNEDKQFETMAELFETKLDAVTENLNSFSDKLDKGFVGVYARQDHTNGNVTLNNNFRVKYQDKIDELIKDNKRAKDDKLKRYTDLLWKIILIAVAIAFGVERFF